MMHVAALPTFTTGARFDYFDIIALVWLIIGLFRGRKRGMSQELLPTLQWIGIVVLAGLYWWSLSSTVKLYASFSTLWCNITAYLVVALGVHLIYLLFKQAFGEKLVEWDPFGKNEFYLGMVAGVIRYACMLLAAMALMNARLATAAEMAASEKYQAENFSGIRFPTPSQVQQDVLFKSFTGNLVESYLRPVLITAIAPPSKLKKENLGQKKTNMIDDILSKPTNK
jgi:hypothetical protein